MGRCAHATAAVVIGALAACAPGPSRAAHDATEGGRVTALVDAGFDSFQERYSIVDEDTLDSITEFRSRLALGYQRGSLFGDYFHLQATAMVGDENAEYGGQLDWSRRLGPRSSRIAVFADVTRRSFLDGSSYDYANDHTRYYAKAYGKWEVSESFALRLTERIEQLDFQERTEFDYNYTRHSVGLSGELARGLSTYLSTGVRYTTMTIPDSTQIQYESWTPEVEFRAAPGLYKVMFIRAGIERRHYAHEPERSSYWALFAGGSAELPLSDQMSVALHDETESYSYDNGTGVYFDYTETRNALLLKYNRSWSFRAGAGPAFAVLSSRESPDDEYTEFGGKLTVEYYGTGGAWVSMAYEPGRRRYRTFDASSDVPSIYSDYTYNRVNALASVRVWDGVSLSALVDYQPEDHEREGDDATATLFSLSLTYAY
jgi:hypothetical protein